MSTGDVRTLVEPLEPHPDWCGRATPIRLQVVNGELLATPEPQMGALEIGRAHV